MSLLPKLQRLLPLILASFLICISLLTFFPEVATAGDANSSTNQEPDEGASGSEIPSQPPSGADGLPVHRERCANCHGELGMGDGELALELPNPPAAHASVSYLREIVPADMFGTITNGRAERGMPPFGPSSSNPLTDQERWNVLAAIYSMGTPVESIEAGQAFYEETCVECHGDTGKGDGPRAAEIDQEPGDLSSLSYWLNTSNRQVFDAVNDGAEFHSFDSDDDLWSIIDYMRTFSYEYVDALEAFRPIKVGSVSGQVSNGTTGEPGPESTVAVLRAFTQDLDITLTLTDTLDSEGRYFFGLSDIPQDWYFRTSIDYSGIDFGSDFGQLSFDQPDLELPITLFEPTTDPDLVNIEQLHIILSISDELVNVSELYVASYGGPAVFVGESGQASDGTFQISLPEGATNINFSRGFGSVDSFIPANEIVPSGSGWADTMPLRPGIGTLNMLVQYSLRYDDGASFSHPVNYQTSFVNLVIPDVGVTLQNEGSWLDTGQQAMGDSAVLTFSRSALQSNDILDISLEGKPRNSSAISANLVTDNKTEIVVGATAALGVVLIAIVLIRQWQNAVPAPAADRYLLLEEIAALDDAYERGEISQRTYEQEREILKAELVEIWEEDNSIDHGSPG